MIWSNWFGIAIAQNESISGVYSITPQNTELKFSAKHFGVINVQGDFSRFHGSLTLENNIVTMADFVIEVASITTHNESRDKSLRNEQFLDVSSYPEITFKIKKNREKGVAIGDLGIKNVTRRIRFEYAWSVSESSTQLTVEGTISRKNFQLEFGQMDGLVSDEIKFNGFVTLKVK